MAQVTDRALTELSRGCASLESLDLHSCRHVSEAGVLAVAAGCPLLRTIVLSNAEGEDEAAATDEALRALARGCPRLEHLAVNVRTAHSAHPHRAPCTRRTADPMHRVCFVR